MSLSLSVTVSFHIIHGKRSYNTIKRLEFQYEGEINPTSTLRQHCLVILYI